MEKINKATLQRLRKNSKIDAVKERIEYYLRELDHGELACEMMLSSNGGSNSYYTSSIEYIKILKTKLQNALVDAKQLHQCDEDSFKEKYRVIKQILILAPRAIHNILISALQRKFRPIRYFSYSTFPTYSFAEAHPTYATEIIALEKINENFYNTLDKITDKFKFYVPLICLSDKSEYAYASIPVDDMEIDSIASINNNERDPGGAEFRSKVEEYFLQSQILMPRWGPANLRFAVFIAHEMFHPLITLIRICRANYMARKYTPEVPPIEDMYKKGIDINDNDANAESNAIYGEGVFELIDVYDTLYASFAKLLESMNRKYSYSHYEIDVSIKQLNEFLCDLGGVFLCGPSFVYAFIADLLEEGTPWDKREGSDKFLISCKVHPPKVLRLQMMIEVLRIADHKKTSLEVNSFYYEQKLKAFCETNFKLYSEWIGSKETIEAINDFYYCLVKYGISRVKDYTTEPYVNENEFRNTCTEIIRKIDKKDHYLNDHSPVTLLNAIWHKILTEDAMPRYHMLWRLAFKNCCGN